MGSGGCLRLRQEIIGCPGLLTLRVMVVFGIRGGPNFGEDAWLSGVLFCLRFQLQPGLGSGYLRLWVGCFIPEIFMFIRCPGP